MERAVPATRRLAPAKCPGVEVGHLRFLAISSTWALVTLPGALVLFGTPLPLGARPPRAAGGWPRGGLGDEGERAVRVDGDFGAGMISPLSLAVLALKALQNSLMLTPCGPSAVPTGGAGLACPAGICILTTALIFFAMASPLMADALSA